jgi:hypothetical protein
MIRYILMIPELDLSTIIMYIILKLIILNQLFLAVMSVTLATSIKQIRNNCLFKKKLKELLIKGFYYSIEYMNNDFINTGF